MTAAEAIAAIKLIVDTAVAAVDPDTIQLRSKLEEVKKLALDAHLAFKDQLAPECVGVHPDNRDGCGVSGLRVQLLGHDIVEGGWATDETRSATAFEDLPDGRGALFTVRQQEESELLPRQIQADIRYLALACTHTNALLNAIKQGVPCDDPMLSVDGKMSESKILERCPSMKEPLEKGMDFFVFRKQLWEQVPYLPWLCQAGANKPGKAHRRPTLYQSLTSMQGFVSRSMISYPDRKDIDRNACMKHAQKDCPPEFVEQFPGMLDWIQAYGGGSTGIYTKEVCSFAMECCKHEPFVPGQIFKAMGVWKIPGGDRCPLVAVAVLKWQTMHPKDKVTYQQVVAMASSPWITSVQVLLLAARKLCTEQPGGSTFSTSMFFFV